MSKPWDVVYEALVQKTKQIPLTEELEDMLMESVTELVAGFMLAGGYSEDEIMALFDVTDDPWTFSLGYDGDRELRVVAELTGGKVTITGRLPKGAILINVEPTEE